MKKKVYSILIFTLIVLINSSCNKQNRFNIDTNENRVEVKIKRFDKDLLAIDTATLEIGVKSLYAKYASFLPYFTENIIETQSTDTTAVTNLISAFITDTAFTNVNKKALVVFNDISDIENKVSEAYTYIHHYFPKVQLPEIYFFVSGYNSSVLMNREFIAFGTDMYLGADYEPYQQLSYKYQIKNMRRESMAVDIVSTTLFRMFVNNSDKDRLLDDMIFRGKVMYLLASFMPDENPENLMGYTADEWKWCENFKKEIWTSIIDHKDLFSSDQQLIRKYMNEAPFTAPISQESPGRVGTWLGWQIIVSYMKNNNKCTLTELMDENNAQTILENSGFKP